MSKIVSSVLSIIIMTSVGTSSFSAHAEEPMPIKDFYAVRPADVECVIEAAKKQFVPANVLLAIHSKEYGKNGQISAKNSNGSVDLGHFQINTIHWKKGGSFALTSIKQEDVTWRGCYNAELAAYLLRQVLYAKNNQDFWTRAANYHSHTPKFNTIYKKDLIPLSIKWGKYLEQRYSTASISYR